MAHSLTRYAIGIPDFLVWMEDVPPHIRSVLQVDLVCYINKVLISPLKKKKKTTTHQSSLPNIPIQGWSDFPPGSS